VSQASFAESLSRCGQAPLRRRTPSTVQVNVTKRCNLACQHCHVESSPRRKEEVDRRTADRIATLLERSPVVRCLDLTGGAPEMGREFRFLVETARTRGLEVIDRSNLTIFFEDGYGDLPAFLARERVRIVASLPSYDKTDTDRQRGRGVFKGSIEALRWLNRLGYARPGSGLTLDLMYNPTGPTLPPSQAELEREYRQELRERFGIEFDRLLTLTNMPILRWRQYLERHGEYDRYMALLVERFNLATVESVMCRDLVSIAHDGRLYDCDFNQQLDLAGPGPATLWDIESFDALSDLPVATAEHCFGCTAGSGSSCSGALS
jgi:radical SAM/Cys-rich protein